MNNRVRPTSKDISKYLLSMSLDGNLQNTSFVQSWGSTLQSVIGKLLKFSGLLHSSSDMSTSDIGRLAHF